MTSQQFVHIVKTFGVRQQIKFMLGIDINAGLYLISTKSLFAVHICIFLNRRAYFTGCK